MPHPESFVVKPATGVRIADPKTGEYVPENGLRVPRSGFWLRRLKDGDVIEVKTSASKTRKSEPVTAVMDGSDE